MELAEISLFILLLPECIARFWWQSAQDKPIQSINAHKDQKKITVGYSYRPISFRTLAQSNASRLLKRHKSDLDNNSNGNSTAKVPER